VNGSQVGDSADNPAITTDQLNTTSASGEGTNETDDSRCPACQRVPGESCQCIEVPYGYLLDYEIPSERMDNVEARPMRSETKTKASYLS
jgi:hypothetical protein